MGIQFNDGQLQAIKKAIKWYFVDSFNQQVFSLGGLAGTRQVNNCKYHN